MESGIAIEQARGRRLSTSAGLTVATCVDGTQAVTSVLSSVTELAFRPGALYTVVEFHGCSSKGCGAAVGDFDLRALPVRSPR